MLFRFFIVSVFLLTFVSCSTLRPERSLTVFYYAVEPGDTLSGIGRRFAVSAKELVSLNDVSDPRELQIGQIIQVPYIGQKAELAYRRRGPVGLVAALKLNPSSKAGLKKISLGPASVYVGKLMWPLKKYRVTGRFGWRGRSFHEGIDLAAPSGTPLYAAHDGTVVYSGRGLSGYGNLIVLRASQGLMTVYAHNRRNRVKAGQIVKRGTHIADVGATGRATGPHVHFETRVLNHERRYAAVDPKVFFR